MSAHAQSVSFVVDTDPVYGRGHISRCLLLAMEMREQGAACDFYPTHEIAMPGLQNFPVKELSETDRKDLGIVIVDGYRFETHFLNQLKNRSAQIVLIDDLADRPFPANVVLNHNIYAEQLDYSSYAGAKLLLGPGYGLVRKEFFELRQNAVRLDEGRVLVTFGSGPVARRGVELGRVLNQRLGCEVDVVLGSEGDLPKEMNGAIRLHQWADLAKLCKHASIVICGLGVTFLEMIATERPLIGIKIVDNQGLAYTAATSGGYQVFDRLDVDVVADAAGRMLRGGMKAQSCFYRMDSQGPKRAVSAILRG